MDNSTRLTIQRALEDNTISPEEVQQILRAYDFDIRWNNRLIENVLSEHGHTVFLSEGYRQSFLKAQKADEPAIPRIQEVQVPEYNLLSPVIDIFVDIGRVFLDPGTGKRVSLEPKTKQRLIWLSIVGPAALASLIGVVF